MKSYRTSLVSRFRLAAFRYRPITQALLSGSLLGIVGTVASADTSPAEATKIERPADDSAARVNLDFSNTPLPEAVAIINQQLDKPLLIDHPVFLKNGLDPDLPIDVHLHGISMRSALRHIASQYEFAIVEEGEYRRLTTVEEAENQRAVRCFPVWDLVMADHKDASEQPDYESLIAAITSELTPDSWEEVGGFGSLHILGGNLLVSQRDETNEHIARLLAALRQLPLANQASPDMMPRGVGWVADSHVENVLDKTTTLEFIDTPLCDVVDVLNNRYPQLRLTIDRAALELSGIDPGMEITKSIGSVSLRSAIQSILRDHDLSLAFRNELMLITTREEAESQLETRVYPIAGLLSTAPDQTMRCGLDEIITALTGALNVESWAEVGGTGSVSPFPQRACLIVSQTYDVHCRLQHLLDNLYRAIRAKEAAPRTAKPVDEDELITAVYWLHQETDRDEQVTTTPNPSANASTVESPSFSGIPPFHGGLTDPFGLQTNLPKLTPAEIERLIRGQVRPESWNGEKSVTSVPGRLIVRHTRATHGEIVDFLRQLGLRPHSPNSCFAPSGRVIR